MNKTSVEQQFRFQRVAADSFSATTPLRLVYFGTLARSKGLYELVRGLSLANSRGAGARLTISGIGPERMALKEFCETQGLATAVSIIGPLFGADKAALLDISDLTLIPIDADFVVHEHGLRVRQNDAQEMARLIERLAHKRKLPAPMEATCRQRQAPRQLEPCFAAA